MIDLEYKLDDQALFRAIFVEDEDNRINEFNSLVQQEGFPIQVSSADLSQANAPNYWKTLGTTANDLLVLDLNLQKTYSGMDVLKIVARLRILNQIELNKILVCTSVEGYVDPDRPNVEIATLPQNQYNLEIFGLQKSVENGHLVGYAPAVLAAIESIYYGERVPLNIDLSKEANIPRVILIEDDPNTITEARLALETQYRLKLVNLPKMGELKYWAELQFQPRDYLVVDINLSKKLPKNINGVSVLALLNREKQAGKVPGLERALVYTSQSTVRNDFTLKIGISTFPIYVREKGINSTGQSTTYGEALRQFLDDVRLKRETPINQEQLVK